MASLAAKLKYLLRKWSLTPRFEVSPPQAKLNSSKAGKPVDSSCGFKSQDSNSVVKDNQRNVADF